MDHFGLEVDYINMKKIQIIGWMSLRQPLLNIKDIEWLEEWLFYSSQGIPGFYNRYFNISFTKEKSFLDTIKFLKNSKTNMGWTEVIGRVGDMYSSFLAPNGCTVKFDYKKINND